MIAIFSGVRWNLTIVLIWIILWLKMSLLAVCTSEKCLLISVAHFLVGSSILKALILAGSGRVPMGAQRSAVSVGQAACRISHKLRPH